MWTCFFTLTMILTAIVCSESESVTGSRDSLDSFIYDYTLNTISSPHPLTGKPYQVSLPDNLSDIRVSFIRLRSSSMWRNGVNHSSIEIPPKTKTRPFCTRVDLVYQNLVGDLSSFYYGVPDHTLISPVLGILPYDHSNSSNPSLDLDSAGIRVTFPSIPLRRDRRCVRFDADGTVEFSEVMNGRRESFCIGRKKGHFCIVIPSEKRNDEGRGTAIGIVAGVVAAAMLLGLGVGTAVSRRKRRRRKLEVRSEKGESLGWIWVGQSRMPIGSTIRTQPMIENNYIP
ncbi:hypothetical protein M569_15053 [Genlisea aurea]|uniref:Uncharacterized protein n=1 Tax=Genlisea aurea TaxID=192259 RepID=S8DJT4_9LAMI|nr:hypothetical protein M569_15053 [Genlisea aurea]